MAGRYESQGIPTPYTFVITYIRRCGIVLWMFPSGVSGHRFSDSPSLHNYIESCISPNRAHLEVHKNRRRRFSIRTCVSSALSSTVEVSVLARAVSEPPLTWSIERPISDISFCFQPLWNPSTLRFEITRKQPRSLTLLWLNPTLP